MAGGESCCFPRSILAAFAALALLPFQGVTRAAEPEKIVGADKDMTDIEYSLGPIRDLTTGELNQVKPLAPRVRLGDWGMDRHTPVLFINSPWKSEDSFPIEVPEYSWAQVPGDPHNDSPFYYGRSLTQAAVVGWTIRYPSLEKPKWKERPDGGLELDNSLEGGYIQRFKVIPRDRMVEVRFGITNGSTRPLENLRCQLCMTSCAAKDFSDRWPTSSNIFARGKVTSWDGASQDLSWLNKYGNKETGQFRQSAYFIAQQADHRTKERPQDRGDLMWFDGSVDIPAIAKRDSQTGKRYVVVYSPFGRNAFYNCLGPCFHADPEMKRIAPGETRWTVSYYIFFEGDLQKFFERLAAIHEKVKRDEGILEE